MNRIQLIGCIAQQEARARALASCSEATDFAKMQAEAVKLAETTRLDLLQAWVYVNEETERAGIPTLAAEAVALDEKLNRIIY